MSNSVNLFELHVIGVASFSECKT